MAGAYHRVCDLSNDAMDQRRAVAFISNNTFNGIMTLHIAR
jgi:hypothetical protein